MVRLTSFFIAAALTLAPFVSGTPIKKDTVTQYVFLQNVQSEYEEYGSIWLHGQVRIAPPPAPVGTQETYNNVTVWIKFSDNSIRPSQMLSWTEATVANFSDAAGFEGQSYAVEFWAQYDYTNEVNGTNITSTYWDSKFGQNYRVCDYLVSYEAGNCR